MRSVLMLACAQNVRKHSNCLNFRNTAPKPALRANQRAFFSRFRSCSEKPLFKKHFLKGVFQNGFLRAPRQIVFSKVGFKNLFSKPLIRKRFLRLCFLGEGPKTRPQTVESRLFFDVLSNRQGLGDFSLMQRRSFLKTMLIAICTPIAMELAPMLRRPVEVVEVLQDGWGSKVWVRTIEQSQSQSAIRCTFKIILVS